MSHIDVNRERWDAQSAGYQAAHAADLQIAGGRAWGVWRVPEAELRVLGDVAGLDVLELGCGAAQWAIALAQDGARVTGLDLSPEQLGHARELVAAAGVRVALVEAAAEEVPLPDASFDIVLSDHGATTFADPRGWMPECARLLRPGGLLAWCAATPWLEACWPLDAEHPGTELVRDIFGMQAFAEQDGLTNFLLPYGETHALLRKHSFVLEDLLELRPSAGATSSYRDATDRAWARRWPMEALWRARRA